MALLDKLKQIDSLTSQFNALQPLSIENDKRLWAKIRLDWNYNSNHIEGNTLTYGETRLLLVFDKTTGDHELREYEEMKAHDVAIHVVKEWAKDKSRYLTESDVRELNKIILVQPYWKEAITPDGQPTRRQIKVGEYKEYPNSVRLKNGEIFQYASPLETPHKMAELMEYYKRKEDDPKYNALILASELHYEFVRIHPFDDGNGRVARLIANYILMRHGAPPIIVKAAEKDKYLTALNKADTGDLEAFHEYMADQLIWSLELAIKAAKGESIEEPEDLDKKVAMLKMEMADVDTDNDVQVQFSQNSFLKIYDSWLSELLKGLILKIKKFDDLFANPTHYISVQTGIYHGIGGHSISENFKDRSADEIINALKDSLLKQNTIISADTIVSIHASYGTFKKGALKNPFGCNYHVEVIFEYLKYEIYIQKFNSGFNNYPFFSKELKDTLEGDTNIKKVYFDANGNHYFNVHKKPDGTLFVNLGLKGEVVIISSYPSEDILSGKIKDGGLVRFLEPRLLHKPLTKSEIDELCKMMGDTIFEHIDYYTKLAGLRK